MSRAKGAGPASSKIQNPVEDVNDDPSGLDNDSYWTRGYVGGEISGEGMGGGRFGEPDDWDGDEGDMAHECEVIEGNLGPFSISKSACRKGYKVL
jgi:hypothetical protein